MTDRQARADNALDILSDVIARARRAGADAADAVIAEGTSLGASWRLGKPEDLERSEGSDLGLRVFVGRRQASVSSSDRSPAAMAELVERAVSMARLAPEDPFCGLADPAQLATGWPNLDLDDGREPSAEELIARARTCEEAALAVDGVTNSEGASAGYSHGLVAIATSGGFAGAYGGSRHSVSVSVIAGKDTGMERDYDHSGTRHLADLEDPVKVGTSAGQRTVRRLGARKMPSTVAPVVFAPRVANSLLGHFAGAINGAAVARGTSFLKDRLGQPVFAPGIEIVDDPLRPRGLRSRPFDGEGVGGRTRRLIEDGRLTTWLIDSTAGRQLGLPSTGHASRGTSGPPSPAPTNLYLAPGRLSPEELIADIAQGFYVVELIGFGVNGITGDYSRGAAGFWIENGKVTFPVSELTIAGNLKDMFARLVPANDLVFRYGSDAPTLRIDDMAIAGT